MRGPGERECAFTLIELIVSVFIMAIFAVVAITAAAGTVDKKAEVTSREVQAAVTFGRAESISRRETRRVVFDVSTDSVRVTDGSGDDVSNPLTQRPYRWVLENGDIQSADFDGANYLEWNLSGDVISGGSVVVFYPGLTQTFTIAPVTGHVTVGEVRN